MQTNVFNIIEVIIEIKFKGIVEAWYKQLFIKCTYL